MDQLPSAGGACSPDKPVGYDGCEPPGKSHPRCSHRMYIDATAQRLAYTLSVPDSGRYSRRRSGGRKRDIAMGAVAVVTVGTSTKVIRGAIERRSDVVNGVEDDRRRKATTAQEK